MNTTGDAAVTYARHGWPVFPLWWATGGVCACRDGKACTQPAKHPMTRHGLHDATTNVELLTAVWEQHPHANIGIRTGVAFDVLDIDSVAADSALGRVASQAGCVVPDVWAFGPMAVTSRGHHLFYAPTGHGNRTRLHGIDGADWRGRNGYVVAAPSVHASGHVYTWHEDCPYDAPLPLAPAVLVDALVPHTPTLVESATYPPTALASVEGFNPSGLLRTMAGATVGNRNRILNWATYKMACGYHQQRMTGSELHGMLTDLQTVAVAQGLTAREVNKTFQSVLYKVASVDG